MKKPFALISACLLLFGLVACGTEDAVQNAVRDILGDVGTPASSSATSAPAPAAPAADPSEASPGPGGGTMILSNASNTAPAGAFDLPEGYTEMEL